jgi:hypothetical protein
MCPSSRGGETTSCRYFLNNSLSSLPNTRTCISTCWTQVNTVSRARGLSTAQPCTLNMITSRNQSYTLKQRIASRKQCYIEERNRLPYCSVAGTRPCANRLTPARQVMRPCGGRGGGGTLRQPLLNNGFLDDAPLDTSRNSQASSSVRLGFTDSGLGLRNSPPKV